MTCDAYCRRRLTSVTDLAITVTFKSTTVVSAVTCSLKDKSGAAAGTPPVTNAAGTFLNSSGTLTTDTIWVLSFEDFDPSTLALVADIYTMSFKATPSDGDDREVGVLGIRVVS